MKRRIIFCCNVYPPNFIGGAELIAHSQALELKKNGHEVIVFTGDISEFGKRHSIRREVYEGLTVFRIRLVSEDYEPEYINFYHEKVENYFKEVINSFSPDVVHFHNIIGLSLGLISIAKQRGIKTVLTLMIIGVFAIKIQSLRVKVRFARILCVVENANHIFRMRTTRTFP